MVCRDPPSFNCVCLFVVLISFVLVVTYTLVWPKPRPKCVRDKHCLIIMTNLNAVGRQFAQLCAKRGAHVTIIARDAKELECVLWELNVLKAEQTQRIVGVKADITNPAETAATIAQIDDDLEVFLVMNTTTLAILRAFEDINESDIEVMFDHNFYATIIPLLTLVPRMKKRKEGIIIIYDSQLALYGFFGTSIYSASKFALRGVAEALRMELHCFDVSVTIAFAPFCEHMCPKAPREAKSILKKIPRVNDDIVAQTLFCDAMHSRFYSCFGDSGQGLGTLCVGVTVPDTFWSLWYQFFAMGFLRVYFAFRTYTFYHFPTICQACEGGKLVVPKKPTPDPCSLSPCRF